MFHFQNSILLFLLSVICATSGQQLTTQLAGTKLSTGMYHIAPYYDGDDTIYLFGDNNNIINVTNGIFAFTISTERIELLNFVPTVGNVRRAQSDSQGNIIYFGQLVSTELEHTRVYAYNPITNQIAELDALEQNVQYGTSIKPNASSNKFLIIGGSNNQANGILEYDINDSISNLIGSLPKFYRSTEAVSIGNSAIIFGNVATGAKNSITKLNLETLETEEGPATLPEITGRTSAVTDGSFSYIIGGYDNESTNGGIYKIDPESMENEFLSVSNFPVEGTDYFVTAPSTVYVEKLNRIYMFGGYSKVGSGYRIHDEIWYIDLKPEESTSTTEPPSTTLNPDLFTCEDRIDGFYPNPYNCDGFIGCHNSETEFYTCPFPLLFNPSMLVCDFPENVRCDLSCDKPDGMYPHPHDCALFYGCNAGIIEIYKCPPPLLFDPVRGTCTFPEQVDCQIM